MLYLTRTEGESISIYPEDIPENMTVAELFAGGPINVEIRETRSHQCRLGIHAPEALRIARN